MQRPTPPAYAMPAMPTPRRRRALFGWLGAMIGSLLAWLLVILILAVTINAVSGAVVLIIIGRHL